MEGAAGAESARTRGRRAYFVPPPSRRARARARAHLAEAPAAGGGRSCGRRGRSDRRAERGVGGSSRAGRRARSVSSSICRGRVCPETDRRTDRLADGLGSSPCARGQLQRGSGLAARASPPARGHPGSGGLGARGAGRAGAALRRSVLALLSPDRCAAAPERRP